MTPPDITFRLDVSPYSVIADGDLTYGQSKDGVVLPVVSGESSDPIYFRIYNNFALNASIADATNVDVTAVTGGVATDHDWLVLALSGVGEGATTPGSLYDYEGIDTPVGGSSGADKYIPEMGSDHTNSDSIRAGASNAGCGFMAFKSYAQIPSTLTSIALFLLYIRVEYSYV